MPKKTFDCVEMKRCGAARIYELTKDMTPEQELAFWQNRNEAMRQRFTAVCRQKTRRSPQPPRNAATRDPA